MLIFHLIFMELVQLADAKRLLSGGPCSSARTGALQRLLQGLAGLRDRRGSQLTRLGALVNEALSLMMRAPRAADVPTPRFRDRASMGSRKQPAVAEVAVVQRDGYIVGHMQSVEVDAPTVDGGHQASGGDEVPRAVVEPGVKRRRKG